MKDVQQVMAEAMRKSLNLVATDNDPQVIVNAANYMTSDILQALKDAGYEVVPREPTEDALKAIDSAITNELHGLGRGYSLFGDPAKIYRAMLSAHKEGE